MTGQVVAARPSAATPLRSRVPPEPDLEGLGTLGLAVRLEVGIAPKIEIIPIAQLDSVRCVDRRVASLHKLPTGIATFTNASALGHLEPDRDEKRVDELDPKLVRPPDIDSGLVSEELFLILVGRAHVEDGIELTAVIGEPTFHVQPDVTRLVMKVEIEPIQEVVRVVPVALFAVLPRVVPPQHGVMAP